MSHGVQALLRIGRNTPDLDRTLAFYRDAVGFRVDDADAQPPAWTRLPGVAATPARCARMTLGGQTIELTEFPHATPVPADAAACDLAFQHCAIVVDDMAAAHRCVLQHGATPITRDGPQTLPPSTGSVTAFKFRDPDGHPLEILRFPAGTGDPRWQSAAAPGAPALGIDHSAISVADIERSIRFYALLGLDVAARGVNRGAGQQRLDDLADVAVDVVALRARASPTPHLELLGYRDPRGRANPCADATAAAADRTVWQAEAIDVLLDALDDAGFTEAVAASDYIDGATIALLRDPDGHALVLTGQVPRSTRRW